MKILNNKNKIDKPWNFEEENNVVGFFALLLKIDKRVNPYLYKKNKANKPSSGNSFKKLS